MARESVMVYGSVKSMLQELKIKHNLKNESEAVAYLIAVNEQRSERITLKEHQEALERMKVINNQQSL